MNPSPGNRDVFSISRLNAEVRAVVEGSFPLLWIEGEISNLTAPRSGHLYFSLKDAHAQVRCALFRGKRQLLRTQPGNGDQVLVRARVSFYEPRGDFQLIIEHLEPAGAGTAQREFEALKRKLQAEGLFASERKKDLPAFPRRLGVITSPSGAAIHDVLQVLRRRAPYLPVTVFPAQVQGKGAAQELFESLQIALQRADCDVLLLTRGGGSIEDLAAFNDERLARLIADATIPLVSAVGHEIDFTIADFVADRRAPTPSAAAELISPDSAALQTTLRTLAQRLDGVVQRRLGMDGRRLEALAGRLRRAAPAHQLRQQQQRLDGLDIRLLRVVTARLAQDRARLSAAGRRLQSHSPTRRLGLLQQRLAALPERLAQAWRGKQQRHHERLAALARELQAVSPLATMQRGYAVLRMDDSATIVNSVSQLAVGDPVKALLADGTVELHVDGIGPPLHGDTPPD